MSWFRNLFRKDKITITMDRQTASDFYYFMHGVGEHWAAGAPIVQNRERDQRLWDLANQARKQVGIQSDLEVYKEVYKHQQRERRKW